MSHGFNKVVVVGAGPSGLLLALLLAQHGIRVDVLEASGDLDKRPRGVGYGPEAVEVLRRANVLEQLLEKGMSPDSLTWRLLDGTPVKSVTGLNGKATEGNGLLIYPVEDLAVFLLEEVNKQPSATVLFNHKVVSVDQNESTAWVDIESGGRFEADFVVGCDGASSSVRKALFGGSFPGKTWDKIFVGANILYDFKKFNWQDISLVVHPEHFANICHINRKGVWRVGYAEEAGLSLEQVKERMPGKLQRILPGNPTPDQYEVLTFSPYSMHQRCAEHMKVGRVMLAADAAHLCNPIGGLGLTTGIADIGSLVDCLYGIYDGKAGLDILDKYDEARRNAYHTVTDPISSMNLKRIQTDTDSVLNGQDPFFAKAEAGVVEQFRSAGSNLSADLTSFYK